MFTPRSFLDQLLFMTVRVETNVGSGTGFFYSHQIDDKILPLIITNKHVIEASTHGAFYLHHGDNTPDLNTRKPIGHSTRIQIERFQEHWIPHPNPEVDLCALQFAPILTYWKEHKWFPYFFQFQQSSIAPPALFETLGPGEEIAMVGYPNGIWDSINNLPIVRRGSTASPPGTRFEGRPEFVIDAACFPGSSGSPVILANAGSYYDNASNRFVPESRIALLGVLWGGPVMTAQGEIRARPIPTSAAPTVETQIMIHLGYVVHAGEIIKLAEHIIEQTKDGRIVGDVVMLPDSVVF